MKSRFGAKLHINCWLLTCLVPATSLPLRPPQLFMLSTDDRLDEKALHSILLSGHSRIPVFKHGDRWEKW